MTKAEPDPREPKVAPPAAPARPQFPPFLPDATYSGADPLTSLMQAAAFRQALAEELLPQAQTSGDPLTLALVDVDSFLAVNEDHGRAAGDALLQAVVGKFQELLPDTARPARYGGDEFAVALPDTRLDDAFTLFEEVRRQVAALVIPAQPDVRVTVSVGLAACPTHATNDVELVRAADQALYVAKINGRNRVALPLSDSRMVTKTSYYTSTQLERLARLAKQLKRNEASLLREALDGLLKHYDDRLGAPRG